MGAAKGMSDAAQARELGLSRNTVRKWREAFQGGGVRALRDAPRSGRKRTISLATERTILAARKPGDGKLKPIEDAPGSYVKVRAQ